MALNQTTVFNPASASYADGSTVTASAGKQGETLCSEIHGKWYTAAYRGHAFWSATAAAGVTIPISTTTAATFMFYNPIGSGVNCELVSIDLGAVTLTQVVGTFSLGMAAGLTVAPTGLTALTATSSLAGSNAASVAKAYSAATVVATTLFYPFGQYSSTGVTAVPGINAIHHEFDGKLNLAPGSLVHVVCTAAQTQASHVGLVWAEWPV